MAAIEFLSSPQDLSAIEDSSWNSYDVTSHMTGLGITPSGVLLRYRYTGGTSANEVGFRRGDSTDDYRFRSYSTSSVDHAWQFAAIGIDTDDQFDAYFQSGAGTPHLELLGFFNEDDVVFFQNATAYNATNGSYGDVDISSATGADTAVAAIFQWDNPRATAGTDVGWRAKGSTDDIYGAVGSSDGTEGLGACISKCDGSEVFQLKVSSSFATSNAIKLVGYIKSGVTFFDPATDKATATTASWVSVTVGADYIGAYFEFDNSSGTNNITVGISEDGSADDTKGDIREHSVWFVELDGSGNCEQYIEAATSDLHLRMAFDADATDPAITGDVDIVMSPTATLVHNIHRTITGDTDIVMSPTATMTYNLNAAISGTTDVVISPTATMTYNLNASISGTTDIVLSPTATLDYTLNAAISGTTDIVIAPTATLVHNINRAITGDTDIVIVPTATMSPLDPLIWSDPPALAPSSN